VAPTRRPKPELRNCGDSAFNWRSVIAIHGLTTYKSNRFRVGPDVLAALFDRADVVFE
jgi:hypothetical protein